MILLTTDQSDAALDLLEKGDARVDGVEALKEKLIRLRKLI
jgi:hypothetical protein